jgi:hypothetical protein
MAGFKSERVVGFIGIRSHYQSITPTASAGPRQRDPVSQHHDRNGRKRKTSDI